MNRIRKTTLALVLAAAVLLSCAPAASADSALKVGAARADITGPITDISTGYNSLGDLMEGLLTRLYARAFVVDDGTEPMVIVSAELVHMTESIKPGVLKKLRADGYSVFSEENVMLTATHCHASTSNTAWVPLYDLVNGTPGYDDESYAVIVRGVARAIEQAYDTRVPGSVSLVYGETEIPTSNRSADAFLQNHTASALGYDVAADGSFSYETGLRAAQSAVNHEMAGIVLTDAQGRDLGFLNFYGSHGTSNPITNRLVASDHKGYAALEVEREMGGGFVAAFAQADSGDASPNAVDPADYHKAFLRPTDLDPRSTRSKTRSSTAGRRRTPPCVCSGARSASRSRAASASTTPCSTSRASRWICATSATITCRMTTSPPARSKPASRASARASSPATRRAPRWTTPRRARCAISLYTTRGPAAMTGSPATLR